ncbi:MAG: phospholipase A [Pseudomonadales bacterium]|nr:phospholipase A [Pseudomonadales bacterium]MBO6564128.1 phospholipase A [Pseudomonadales bacterium]MBO6597602.1 phospholipase A [Pseudomonadales bacterium]MBO6657741.1 phospholipase A [Pseudomonadales bacterium]MBO6824348.1 phospholipase A [Pseudomonadales bacterium]
MIRFALLLVGAFLASDVHANNVTNGYECAKISDAEQRLECYDSVYQLTEPTDIEHSLSVIENRRLNEEAVRDNWFAITPHRPNYILPATYNTSPDFSAYGPAGDLFSDTEVKFQLSLKTLLFDELWQNSSVSVAYTQQSFWQLYAEDEISAPFRETNYEPEFMWEIPLNHEILGFEARQLTLGLVHQSNGRAQPLSRSWNRVYSQIALDRGNLAVMAKVWTRIDDPDIDDNPRVEEYMGRAEFGFAYRYRDHTFSMDIKNSLGSDYRSGVELNWMFPLAHHLKGFVQIYSGYGESMIDMEQHINRIGIGVALSDWL